MNTPLRKNIDHTRIMKVLSGYYSLVGISVALLISSSILMMNVTETRELWSQDERSNQESSNRQSSALSLAPVLSDESPVVYTFFDDLSNVHEQHQGGKRTGQADHEILDAWTHAWQSMGYTPKVLTLDDAKRHPDYERFSTLLDQKVPLGSNKAYDKICYLRWLAIAASGGGIMSDFDTVPLRTPHPDDFIIPEKFTFYQSYVPSLLKGSAEQYTEIANALLDQALKPHIQGLSIYSDMLALSDVMLDPQYQEIINEHRPRLVMNAIDFLERGDNKYTVRECERLAKLRAVHFQSKSEYAESPLIESLLQDSQYESHRATIMAKWPTYWPIFFKEHCHGKDFEYTN